MGSARLKAVCEHVGEIDSRSIPVWHLQTKCFQMRCLLNIWGVMLFLRLTWVVGQAGISKLIKFFTDLDYWSENLIIIKLILTTFESSVIFWGSWVYCVNWLHPKAKPPWGNFVCLNQWNALRQILSIWKFSSEQMLIKRSNINRKYQGKIVQCQ